MFSKRETSPRLIVCFMDSSEGLAAATWSSARAIAAVGLHAPLRNEMDKDRDGGRGAARWSTRR